MDAKKIFRDLQYRIDSTPENGPERDNAIRVRDRLLVKFNLTLADITETRSCHSMDGLTVRERGMLAQYFRKKFQIDPGTKPYDLHIYVLKDRHDPHNRLLEISLTNDEYESTWPKAKSLLAIYRRERTAVERTVAAEAALDDIILPDLQLTEEPRQLTHGA